MTEQSGAGLRKIGFVGVGVMGRPMAANLVKAGYTCTVYDINPAPVQFLVEQGAHSASTLEEVGRNADILITMVVNDAQFLATLFEPGKAAEAMAPGSIVIGMSTMSRNTVQEVAARLKMMGIAYLDAPVSGGEVGAVAGELSIMAGGPDEVMEKCRPVLDVLGKNIYHVGSTAGDGQAVKIINQLLVCVHNAVAAEALTLGAKLGLDKQMLLDIISTSAGNSWIFSNRGPRMVNEEFTPSKSALNILAKDIGFVVDAANRLNHPLVIGSTVQQLYKMAAANGLGLLDDSSIIKLIEKQAGMDDA